jgi:cell division protein FtsA
MHAVTADEGAVRNLLHVVERCHLPVAGLVAAPFASALSVTTEDERQLGVTVVDMGSGTTSFAAFQAGQFVHCEVLATGGQHLTFDIAQNLRVSLAEAERIKALYGSMVNAKSDLSDRFCYTPTQGFEGEPQLMSRAELCQIVQPRIDSLLLEIASRLKASGYGMGQVVLTGGASQLVGIAAAAQTCLGVLVRQGRPHPLPGMATGADSPAFAAVVGLLLVAGDAPGQTLRGQSAEGGSYLQRVGRWIGSGF